MCCLYQPQWWGHRECSLRILLCSGVSIQSTKWWQRGSRSAHYEDYCEKFPAYTPIPLAVSSTHFLLSLLTICHRRWTLGSFLDIDGRPLRVSSSTSSRPYWKRLCQSYTWDFIFFLLFHHTLTAACLISPLVISTAKHKICNSYFIQLQKVSTAMRPFAHYWHKQLFLCL